MDPFPPSRAEAVRLARERGEGLGEKVLPRRHAAATPAGRRQVLLQPVREPDRNAAARPVVGEPHARDAASARREADAVLARALRDRAEQGPRLPDDAPAESDAARQRVGPAAGSADRDPQGSRDARLSRQRREHQVASQRELRPRAARAVLDGRRATTPSTTSARPRARSPAGPTTSSTYKFDAAQHDFGEKTFLGRKGAFNGDDIIRIILEQPVTGEFVAAKLYRYFVREEISPAVKTAARSRVQAERLSDQAADDADPPRRRTSTAPRRTRRRSRARRISSSRPTARWGCARCRPFPTSGA